VTSGGEIVELSTFEEPDQGETKPSIEKGKIYQDRFAPNRPKDNAEEKSWVNGSSALRNPGFLGIGVWLWSDSDDLVKKLPKKVRQCWLLPQSGSNFPASGSEIRLDLRFRKTSMRSSPVLM
jgi:hypothetical protein